MKHSGIVRWYCPLSKEGQIRVDGEESSIWVYGNNILGAKSGFPSTCCMDLKRGQKVTFDIHPEVGAYNVSGGKLDKKQWNFMKKDLSRYSFLKNEEGDFTTGLGINLWES